MQLKGHRGQSDDRAEFIAKNLFENNGREYTTTEKINYLRVSLFYKGPRSVTKLKFERWKGWKIKEHDQERNEFLVELGYVLTREGTNEIILSTIMISAFPLISFDHENYKLTGYFRKGQIDRLLAP